MTALLLRSGLTPRDVTYTEALTLYANRKGLFPWTYGGGS